MTERSPEDQAVFDRHPDIPQDTLDGAPPCPECRAHKCGNCDGRTWDDTYDRATTCPCAADGHPNDRPGSEPPTTP